MPKIVGAMRRVASGMAGYNTAMKILKANGMRMNALRDNDTLPWDSWKYIERKLQGVARLRMVVATDLISRGLTVDLTSEGLGATVYQYQTKSDLTPATRAMNPMSRGQHDRPTIDTSLLPLPCTFKDWDLDVRTIGSNERAGLNIAADQARDAGIVISESTEKTILGTLTDFSAGGGKVQGFLTFDHRTTGSLIAHWDDSGADPYQDIENMRAAQESKKHFGDSIVYVPPNFGPALNRDYNPNSANPLTIRERILKIKGVVDIKVADHLTADNVVMVELDESTVQMIVAVEPTSVQWPVQGGLGTEFKSLCVMVPLLRADQENNSGITHFTK